MIIIPLILNTFYFWIVDNILKLSPDALGNEEIKIIYAKEDNINSTKVDYEKPKINRKISNENIVKEKPSIDNKEKNEFKTNENSGMN